jgi:hypothetical protein
MHQAVIEVPIHHQNCGNNIPAFKRGNAMVKQFFSFYEHAHQICKGVARKPTECLINYQHIICVPENVTRV